MMQRYKFIGTLTELGDRVFSRIGQSADLEEDAYQELVPRAPFLPQEDFVRVGFTEDELDRYGDLANRGLAPESFTAKVRNAVVVLVDIREKLKTRSVREEISTVPEVQEKTRSDGAESEQLQAIGAEPITEMRS